MKLKLFNRQKLSKNDSGELSVGKVIGVVILIIIGLLMLPLVSDAVSTAQTNATEMGNTSTATLLGMVTIFYVLGIVLAAVVWVVAEAKKL